MDSKIFLRKIQDGRLTDRDLMAAYHKMRELELEVLRHKTANFEWRNSQNEESKGGA